MAYTFIVADPLLPLLTSLQVTVIRLAADLGKLVTCRNWRRWLTITNPDGIVFPGGIMDEIITNMKTTLDNVVEAPITADRTAADVDALAQAVAKTYEVNVTLAFYSPTILDRLIWSPVWFFIGRDVWPQ